MKVKKRTRKTSKLSPEDNFVSPLLRQDNLNQKVAFNFPTTSKQADNSKNGNDKNSSLFKENTNVGVTLPHSLLVRPENEFTVSSSKMLFNFTSTTIAPASKSSKGIEAVIPTKGQKVLPHISARPINELLEVPLEPSRASSKKQKKDDMVLEKSLSKLQVESQSTNDQIDVSTVEIKVEPNIINSESSSSESSSSENEDVVLSKVPNIDDTVIVLEDSASEDETDKQENKTNDQEDEILLDDSEVDRMSLSRELDARFQSKKVFPNNCRYQIFVGNLPSSIKKLHVFKFFERYGIITDLKFIRSKVKKTAICFITYKYRSSVNNSLEANGLLYCAHNFQVARIGRSPVIVDCTVMITNLPDDTSSQNLYDVFETCGLIKSQYLARTNDRLLAYITFELKISAAYAVLLNNFRINGRQIYVHQYVNQREKQGLSNKIS